MSDHMAHLERSSTYGHGRTAKASTSRHVEQGASLPDPAGFLRLAGAVIALLIMASLLVSALAAASDTPLARLLFKVFSVDREENLPTFAGFVLIGIAWALAAMTAWKQFSVGSTWWKHWAALAVLLILVSYDEAAQVHEQAIAPVQAYLDTGGIFHFAWVVPGIVFVVLAGLAFLPFMLALPTIVRNMVILSAAIFCAGALGTEMVGGLIATGAGLDSAVYQITVTIEEALEMSGMALFCAAILKLNHADTDGSRAYLAGKRRRT